MFMLNVPDNNIMPHLPPTLLLASKRQTLDETFASSRRYEEYTPPVQAEAGLV